MTENNRAILFWHPDFETDAQQPGLRLSASGGLMMVSEAESIRQAILLLLSTSKGERVMRSAYGCNLEQLVFMPTDDTTLGFAIHLVRRAIQQWEPRIRITRLNAEYNRWEPYRMDIILEYEIKRTGMNDSLTISRPLT